MNKLFIYLLPFFLLQTCFGQNWKEIGPTLEFTPFTQSFYYASCQFVNDSTGFIAYSESQEGSSPDPAYFFYTDDLGVNWNLIYKNVGSVMGGGAIFRFCMYDENKGVFLEKMDELYYNFYQFNNKKINDEINLHLFDYTGSFKNNTYLNSDTLIYISTDDILTKLFLYSYITNKASILNISDEYCISGSCGCNGDIPEINNFYVNNKAGHAVSYSNDTIILYKTNNITSDWTADTTDITGIVNDIFFYDYNTGFIALDTLLLKTDDGGTNWDTCAIVSNTIRKVSFSDSLGYVVGDAGLISESTDFGTSWTVLPPFTGQTINSISIIDYLKVYVGTDKAKVFTNNPNATSFLYNSHENIPIFLYPNPSNNNLTIEFHSDIQEKKISICDFSGKNIYNLISNNQKVINIDISKFKNGIYIVYVQTENGIVSSKFVKR